MSRDINTEQLSQGNPSPTAMFANRRRVLLVEDDPGTAEVIRSALELNGYQVTWYDHADDAMNFFQSGQHHLAILDVRLPGNLDGFDVCRHLRAADPDLAVLFLTVLSDEIDRVVGLELGADDYVTKPFSTRELMARVKSILRRTHDRGPRHAAAKVFFGELAVDFDLRKVEVNGTKVELTTTEFNLLAYLARSPGRAYTRKQLIEEVWGYSSDGYEDSVTVLIQRLRSAIEPAPKTPRYILTVRGIGYRFCEPEELVKG